jgi:hypothetical protein
MEHDGSLEVKEQINSHILPMESHGLHRLLEMRYLHLSASQWRGMAHDGSQEAQEQISLRIRPMESHGRHPLLGMGFSIRA